MRSRQHRMFGGFPARGHCAGSARDSGEHSLQFEYIIATLEPGTILQCETRVADIGRLCENCRAVCPYPVIRRQVLGHASHYNHNAAVLGSASIGIRNK
jgi:hypothetical protein